jgi:hypothetical protein
MKEWDAEPRRPARAGPRTLVGALAIASLLYPLLLWMAFYAEWFIAWSALGHPPRPMLDDPKNIAEIGQLHLVTGVLIMGFLPMGLVAIVLNGLHAFWRHGSTSRVTLAMVLRVVVVLLAWGASIAALRWDPHRVAEWWFD